MTLAHKIMMCLNMWNPDASLHPYSDSLLTHWYRQQMEMIEYGIRNGPGNVPLSHEFLSWDEFRQHFSLPNSDYLNIPTCIQAPSMES